MKKVVIGISGGVDSSVAALLLKNMGYEVIGLFMRNWDSTINNDLLGNPSLENPICPQEADYNDALKVCEKLNIPLHRIDFVKEYWEMVFQYFLDELKLGRTPNPDIMCNKYIKFDLFYKEALKLGADYIATGHYAKIIDGKLFKATDLNKDQSYFLSQINRDILDKVIFPLGDLTKPMVRKMAEDEQLITANKKDSTGICFIGERHFREFLSNYLPNTPGDIMNIENQESIGKHIGLMHYTIGQRRGLDIGGYDNRMFVVGKDLGKNVLYVALGEENEYLYSDCAIIDNINYLSDELPQKCFAKFRYRQEDIPVTVEYFDDYIKVNYPKTKAVTPGQACVLYLEEQCIIGGIIKEVFVDKKKKWYL